MRNTSVFNTVRWRSMRIRRSIVALTIALLSGHAAQAACVNRFVYRRASGERHVVTLLTGKLTYQAAKTLSAQIRDGKAAPLEWVSESGKTLSRQFGDLQVLRPMPVSCDSNTSGVVMSITFVGGSTPTKKISIKLDSNTTVVFDEQPQ
jgi:hypothetical protein